IRLLAATFLRRHRSDKKLTPAAIGALEGYTWPGNVRELENLVQGALVLKREGHIERDDIARRLRGGGSGGEAATGPLSMELPEDGMHLRQTLDRLERDFIRQALRRSDGNKAQAAGLLGMNRTTLVEKLKRHPV
ncbi:MAG: helix-turn-helix domain-containing protein, partial [Myxococcota bacterium]|nr:helix-turn-helix domain-containing protein [Myxococcota bacterium]